MQDGIKLTLLEFHVKASVNWSHVALHIPNDGNGMKQAKAKGTDYHFLWMECFSLLFVLRSNVLIHHPL